MKRPYYLADVNRKRVKNSGTFSIENNALWQARDLVKTSGQTVLVMRDGTVVREILPKSLIELMDDEIRQTERKLERLRIARQEMDERARKNCPGCGELIELRFTTCGRDGCWMRKQGGNCCMKAKFLRSKCEVEKTDLIIQVVRVTSWVSFNDAFEEASKQIPRASILRDVQVSQSADCGYEVKLYFFIGLADSYWSKTRRKSKDK